MNKDRRLFTEMQKLSAYLDGEMNPDQHRIFDAQLQKKPELQDQLKSLRRTKAVVGYLPRLAAPRCYTLTQDMVDERAKSKRSFLIPVRLATSLAAIFLLVLFSVEFIFTNLRQFDTQGEAVMMAKSVVAVEEAPSPLIIWSPSEGGKGGTSFAMRDNSVAVVAPAVAALDVGDEHEENIIKGGVVEPEPQNEAAPDSNAETEPWQFDDGVDLSMLILGINLEEGGQIINQWPIHCDDAHMPQNWYNILRSLQILLGFIFVIGGITWWLLKNY